MLLVGFVIRIYHDARSSGCQTKYYFHSNLPRYQRCEITAANFSLVRITAQKTIDILNRQQSENIKFKLFVSWCI